MKNKWSQAKKAGFIISPGNKYFLLVFPTLDKLPVLHRERANCYNVFLILIQNLLPYLFYASVPVLSFRIKQDEHSLYRTRKQKEDGFWSHRTWIWLPELSVITCVTLGKWLKYSEPQFPDFWNEIRLDHLQDLFKLCTGRGQVFIKHLLCARHCDKHFINISSAFILSS